MSKYIHQLILQGENQHQDFKFEISDSMKIARSLVAFANTDGGRLLLGVKDNGAIAGVRSDEEYYMVEAAATLYSRPEIHFTTREWVINKKTVLEVTIPKSNSIPHYAREKDDRWRVYIRVKDQNLLANSVLLRVWARKKQKKGIVLKYSEPENFLLKYLEINGSITLSAFSRLAGITRKRAESILVDLIVINVVEIIFTEKQVFYRIREGFNV